MAPKGRKAPKTVDEDVQRDLHSLIATSGLTYTALATVLQKTRYNPKLGEVGYSSIKRLTSERFAAIEHQELHGCQPVAKEPTVEQVRLSKLL